jgi:hypothetical protein
LRKRDLRYRKSDAGRRTFGIQTMTKSETFLFDSEDQISRARDLLIAVLALLEPIAAAGDDPTLTAAHRLAGDALESVSDLHVEFEAAFAETFKPAVAA